MMHVLAEAVDISERLVLIMLPRYDSTPSIFGCHYPFPSLMDLTLAELTLETASGSCYLAQLLQVSLCNQSFDVSLTNVELGVLRKIYRAVQPISKVYMNPWDFQSLTHTLSVSLLHPSRLSHQ